MEKPNSIEVEIDKLGRVVIPIQYRKRLGIALQSKMMMALENGGITLMPIHPKCVLCGCQMEQQMHVQLCDECIERIKKS